MHEAHVTCLSVAQLARADAREWKDAELGVRGERAQAKCRHGSCVSGTEQAVARNHNQRVKAGQGGETVSSNLRADTRILEAFCIRGRCTARKVDEAVADKQLTSVAKSCKAEAFVLVFGAVDGYSANL